MYDRMADMERDLGGMCSSIKHMEASIERMTKQLDGFEARFTEHETKLTKAAAVAVIVASSVSLLAGALFGSRVETFMYKWLASHLGG